MARTAVPVELRAPAGVIAERLGRVRHFVLSAAGEQLAAIQALELRELRRRWHRSAPPRATGSAGGAPASAAASDRRRSSGAPRPRHRATSSTRDRVETADLRSGWRDRSHGSRRVLVASASTAPPTRNGRGSARKRRVASEIACTRLMARSACGSVRHVVCQHPRARHRSRAAAPP